MIGAVIAVPIIMKLAAIETCPRVHPKAVTKGTVKTLNV